MKATATGRRVRQVVGSGDRGFSLVEVVVAAVLLGILSTAVLAVLMAAQRASVNDRNRVAAANLAARELDIVRQEFGASVDGPREVADQALVTNPHPLADGTAGAPLVVDSVPYTVTRTSRWSLTGTGASACTGGTLVQHPTLIVSVQVTWPDMGPVQPVSTSTVLAPTKAAGAATTDSFVAVSVTDSAGEGNPGIPVEVSSGGETRAARTDATGCAAVRIAPPPGGAEYTVTLTAPGYVDVSGVARPGKSVGIVRPGQLVTANPMAYDRAGSLTLQVTGDGVTEADLAGTEVSLYRSESTGASPVTTQPATGLTMRLTGLWPSQYGAYLGSRQPAGLPLAQVPPGGAATLAVPYQFARFTVTGAPAGAQVLAVPSAGTTAGTTAGTAACGSARARVVDPASGSLPPGTWSFFARADASPCSPGPAEIPLDPETEPALSWAPTTLQLTDAPTGEGAVWAVSADVATGSCQLPAQATRAVRLGDGTSATVGPVPLPAGTWYVFAGPTSGSGPSEGSPCSDAGPVLVPYGYETVKPWGSPVVEVRVTDVPAGRALVAAPGPITCRGSGSAYYYTVDRTGQNRTDAWGSPSPTTTDGSTVTGQLPQGTWRIYDWTKAGPSGTCTLRGTVTVGSDTPLTLTGTGATGAVGP